MSSCWASVACFLWTFPLAFAMFKAIDMVIGLRVSAEEELEGLDGAEHGGSAYPDFVEVSGRSTSGIPGGPSGSKEKAPAMGGVPQFETN